jgi:hypothetical protein
LGRITRLVFKILGILLLAITTLVVLALMSLDLAPVRAFIVEKANDTLATTFQGKLVLRRLDNVDLRGVGGVDIEVQDPAGRTVLRARNVRVSLGVLPLVYAAVFKGANPLVVRLEDVSIDELRVLLIDDGTGSPTLAHAFDPKDPKPPDPEGGTTVIVIDEIALKTGKVHGSLKSPGPIDVDLKELHATLRTDPAATTITLKRLDLDARQVPQVERVKGRLTAGVFLPAAPKSGAPALPSNAGVGTVEAKPKPAMRVNATFTGDAAGSALALKARLEGERLDATLDISSLSPATVAKLVPALSLRDPATVTAKVEGALSDLGFEAHVRQVPTAVDIRGRFRNANGRSTIEARLDTADVDLSRILKDGPPTRLAVGGDVVMHFAEAGGDGKYRVVLSSDSSFGAYALPETTVDGNLALPSGKAPTLEGTVDVAEAGAPIHVAYAVRAEPAGVVADVNANARLNQPPRLKALSGGLGASGLLELSARFDAGAKRLDANLGLKLRDVRHPAARVGSLDARVTAHGDPAAPKLQMSATALGVAAADRKFESVRLTGSGTPERLELAARIEGQNPQRIELKTTLTPSSKDLLRASSITLTDRETVVTIRAESLSLADGKIELQRLTLDGVGHAEASLVYGRSLEQLEFRAERLQPVPLLRAFGIETSVKSGQIDLEASFAGRGRSPTGKVKGTITAVELGRLKGGTARIDLALERGQISGEVDAELGAGANAKIVVKELDAPLPPLTQQKLANLTGSVSMVGDVELGRLKSMFPFAGIERAEGRIGFDIALDRSRENAQKPSLRAQVRTKSLLLVGQRPDAGKTEDPIAAKNAAPWTVRGIDADVTARFDDQGAAVNGRLRDNKGDLITLDAEWKGIAAQRDLFQPAQALMNSPAARWRSTSMPREPLPSRK